MGDFQIENGCLKKYTGTDAEVVVPDGITRIGETVFDECRNLVNVCLPESVMSIGRLGLSRILCKHSPRV